MAGLVGPLALPAVADCSTTTTSSTTTSSTTSTTTASTTTTTASTTSTTAAALGACCGTVADPCVVTLGTGDTETAMALGIAVLVFIASAGLVVLWVKR